MQILQGGFTHPGQASTHVGNPEQCPPAPAPAAESCQSPFHDHGAGSGNNHLPAIVELGLGDKNLPGSWEM